MSDLLSRLRQWSNGPCAEAAVEIERLTAALAAEREARKRAEEALREIADSGNCGCKPCYGHPERDLYIEIARAALSRTAQPEGGDG